MPEATEATETAPAAEPSYTPPANEPQGLEPKAEETKTIETKPAVKLPASIKPPVKSGRFQARISDLVGQRDTVERENLQLRDRLSRMGAIPREDKTAPAPVNDAKVGTALNPEDFPTYAEYVTALVNHTLKQKEESEKSAKSQNAYEEHKQQRMSTFNEQAAPLAEEYGDGFWDAITDPNLMVSEAMADAVLELDEIGPFTMLWLAAHKEESAKIAKMNPRAATIAIGRLAAQLDHEIKQGNTDGTPSPSSSSASRPTPVPTIRGSAPTGLDNAPADKDTVDEWLKKETDRLRRTNPGMKFYGAR